MFYKLFIRLNFMLLTIIAHRYIYAISHQETIDIVEEICALLQSGAKKDYIGEPISQLEHALQCAQKAIDDHADEETIIAALLHDIGHLCINDSTSMGGYGVKQHEIIGTQYVLKKGFFKKIAQLINGHMQAKRYLTAKYPEYYEKLSDASKKTLKYQGGPMTPEEVISFEQHPFFKEIIKLREWDEQAKEVGLKVTPLEFYKPIMIRLLERDKT